MDDMTKDLIEIIFNAYSAYKTLDEKMTSVRLAQDKWTLKEIIGHLIDSASNNHQRFVRLQIHTELIFPDYTKDNEKWIQIQKYNEMKFKDLLLLWLNYNKMLAHIIKNANPNAMNHCWKIEDTQFTLKELMIDYLRHIRDHLKHFDGRLEEIKMAG